MVTGGHKEGKKEGKPETVRMPIQTVSLNTEAEKINKHIITTYPLAINHQIY